MTNRYNPEVGTSCPLCNTPLNGSSFIRVDLSSNSAILGGKSIVLPPKVAELLSALVTGLPRFLTTAFLMEQLYGLEVEWPDDKIISVQIYHLRKRMLGTGYMIENRPNVGYRLCKENQESWRLL